MKNIGLIFTAAIFSYLGGILIAYLSPTGTSQNAPIICMRAGIIFIIGKIYIYPYIKTKFTQ